MILIMWSHCVFDIAAWQQGVIPSFNLEILGFGGGLGYNDLRPGLLFSIGARKSLKYF